MTQFKATQFAKQVDVDGLSREVEEAIGAVLGTLTDMSRHMEVLELAILKIAQDVEFATDVMVDAGLMEHTIEEAAAQQAGVSTEQDTDEFDRLVEEADQADDDGMPEPESREARWARQEAVHARRAAAIQDQGLKGVEDANESSPIEAKTDPNSIAVVPEEGVTIDSGRDPFTGEKHADE